MKKFRILSFVLALVLCASIFAGCGKKEAKGSDTVLWYVLGNQGPDNEKVFADANKILKEKTGLTVDFKYIDQSQYDLQFAASEKFDLILCPDWLGFWTNVGKGAFQEITEDEFKENAPYIWENGKGQLDAAMYDGKYFCIPAIENRVSEPILIARGDYMDKYGIESLDTIDDIDEFLMAGAKDKSHNIVPFNVPGGQHWNIHLLWAGDWGWASPGTLSYSLHYFYNLKKNDFKVFVAIDQPEEKEFSNTVKRWYDSGVFSKSVLSNPTSSEEAFKNGKSLLAITTGVANANVIYRDVQRIDGAENWDVRFYSAIGKTLRKYNVMNTAVGISRTSENKANALKVLNAVYEDETLYKLLLHGVEGEHYKVDENGFERFADAQYEPPSLGITNESFKFKTKYLFPYADDLQKQLTSRTVDDVLVNCPILADDEHSAINAKLGDVTKEYTSPRMYGAVDSVDAAIKREKEALKVAEIDKYVEFVQKTVDEYVESHPEAIENFKESRKAVNEYNKKNPGKINPKDYK